MLMVDEWWRSARAEALLEAARVTATVVVVQVAVSEADQLLYKQLLSSLYLEEKSFIVDREILQIEY